MKISKFLSMASVASLAVLTLASCGGSEDKSKTIVFYNSAGSTISTVVETAITKFKNEHPEWTVEVVKQSDYDATFNQVVLDLQAGELPSIAYCYPDHVASYMQSGKVVDMKKLMNSTEMVEYYNPETELTETRLLGYTAEEQADFIPTFLNEGLGSNFAGSSAYGYSADSLLCIPFAKSTELMYVNVDALKAAKIVDADGNPKIPTTWAEMWEACEILKEKYPNSYPLCYDSEANWFINACAQNNWDYTSNDPQKHFLFNNENTKAFLTDLRNKYKAGLFQTSTTFGGNYTSDLFKAGASEGCTFCIGSSAGAQYQDPAGAFTWKVASVPGVVEGSSTNPSIISQGPSLVMFDQGSEARQKMTWEFAKYLLDPVFQCSLSMQTGYNPCRNSAYEIEEYQEHLANTTDIKAAAAKAAYQQMASYFTSAVFTGSAQARQQVEYALYYAITGKKSAADALKDAYTACGGK